MCKCLADTKSQAEYIISQNGDKGYYALCLSEDEKEIGGRQINFKRKGRQKKEVMSFLFYLLTKNLYFLKSKTLL